MKNVFCLFFLLLVATCSREKNSATGGEITLGNTVDDDDDDNDDDDDDDEAKSFEAPTYADDYSLEGLSSWANRSRWNLANIHDPTVEKCGEYYYMYSTDASYGNVHAGRGHFPYRRSKDLVTWEFLGMAMATTPAWVKDSLNNIRQRLGLAPISNPVYGHWAPVVRKAGDKYRMYYSIPVDNYISSGLPNTAANFDGSWTERAFIGLMEATDLASNNWEDKGMVVCSSTDLGLNWLRPSLSSWNAYFKWNAIDPAFLIDKEGKHWLIYGSWHSGVVALELNPQTGKPERLKNEPEDYGIRIARRENRDANRWQAQEAPEIIYNPQTDYYYLFLAYDELSVAYNTRVCRSRSVTGPYLGYNGANITQGADCFPILTHPYRFEGHSGWVGIAHCCIFKNPDADEWFYASQGRLPENTGGNAYSNAIMMGHVRAIRWTEDGWPVVMPERYAGVPAAPIAEVELVGTWENIFLNYSWKQQQTSSSMVLTQDKKASGAITGSWSYDAASCTLTVGQHRLYLQRGLDWEANPRVPAIVYAGLTPQGASIWGKKK
ncbi:MAG: arabinan endo-1,5-alpha-L-arabinosidase [Prevotellaceae bacterium]|jgi:arabinan endo-1,5-alpha-L-arabinosidase|nr:arabinan endo-1,5-alpha-L-arabinosidase [Prevotellaceae bacterium]